MVELVRNPAGIEQKGYRRGLMKSVVAKGSQQHHNNAQQYTGKETEKDLLARAEAENQLKQRYLHQKTCQLWELLERLRELGDTQFLQQEWCFGLLSGQGMGGIGVDGGIERSNQDSQPLLTTSS